MQIGSGRRKLAVIHKLILPRQETFSSLLKFVASSECIDNFQGRMLLFFLKPRYDPMHHPCAWPSCLLQYMRCCPVKKLRELVCKLAEHLNRDSKFGLVALSIRSTRHILAASSSGGKVYVSAARRSRRFLFTHALPFVLVCTCSRTFRGKCLL